MVEKAARKLRKRLETIIEVTMEAIIKFSIDYINMKVAS